MLDSPFDFPPGVETEPVAEVAVPTTCRDRIDEDALRSLVAVLAAHRVDRVGVSPVGGLKLFVGVHRPESVHESLDTALDAAGHGVTDHGVEDGFRRLRVGLVDPNTR